jgi:hypothetical protein
MSMTSMRPVRALAVFGWLTFAASCSTTGAPSSSASGGATGGGSGNSGGGPGTGGGSSGGGGGATGGGTGGARPEEGGSSGQPSGGSGGDPGTDTDGPPPPVDSGATEVPPSTGAFKHPGLLWNKTQLDLVRDKVTAGAQPWKAAYDKAMGKYGAAAYKATPFANVECGSYSNPNNGCSEERNDAVAAYTHALSWYVTRDEAHAKKAIEIMNAWSHTLKTHTNSNAPLQTAWGGALWPLSGEIIRHSYDGWAAADVAAFSTMLKDVYLASTIKGSGGTNGNWELVMIEASIKIAVFLDDHVAFDRALEMARKRIPAYFYVKTDGPTPVPPPGGGNKDIVAYWLGQSTFMDGLAQETCRDFTHTQYGIASSLAIAEIAYQQGVNLYGEESERLRAAMEFHADFILGKAVPSTLCGGKLTLSTLPTWEIGYNHFHNRLGLALPLTQKLIETKVRAGSGVDHHMVWETLTHAEAGKAGFQ